MKLSAPVHRLRRKAKLLRRDEALPLHAALDRVAIEEGYRSWSLLVEKQSEAFSPGSLLSRLVTGDLVIVAGRPGQGKTLLGLILAAETVRAGGRSVLFSLEYTAPDVAARLRVLGIEPHSLETHFEADCSDAISAGYIIDRLGTAPRGTLVVIDYLQLLDQRRDTPELTVQIRLLHAFAKDKGLILVFLSQVDRAYEFSGKSFPDIGDIRLPNPVELGLFDKACFVSKGEVRFQATA